MIDYGKFIINYKKGKSFLPKVPTQIKNLKFWANIVAQNAQFYTKFPSIHLRYLSLVGVLICAMHAICMF